jgi:hypothetical protein
MTSEEARIGMRVRVRDEHRSVHLRGKTGTVTHTWGDPHYLALDVLFEDGSDSSSGTTSWRRWMDQPSHKAMPFGLLERPKAGGRRRKSCPPHGPP